jgi:hypothetical protein
MSETIVASLHYKNGQEDFDSEGRKRKFLYNGSGSAMAAGDFGRISYNSTIDGLCVIDLASATGTYSKVVVAAEAIATADYGLFYIEGSGISANLATNGTGTATHALRVTAGAMLTLGASIAHSAAEFGIIDVSFETTTAITITLLGRECVETA